MRRRGITWKCIGDQAGRPWADIGGSAAWGSVKPSHSVPDATASGLLVLAQASGSYFGRSRLRSQRLRRRRRVSASGSSNSSASIPSSPCRPAPRSTTCCRSGRRCSIWPGSSRPPPGPSIARSRDKDRLSILYPSPATVADVVVAPVADSSRGGRVTKLLQSDEMAGLLAQAGWRVDGQPLADGLDPNMSLPDDPGIPAPACSRPCARCGSRRCDEVGAMKRWRSGARGRAARDHRLFDVEGRERQRDRPRQSRATACRSTWRCRPRRSTC